MLGSMINGGTLYLRGSDWNATLAQVSLSYSDMFQDLIHYSGRYSHMHTIDSVEISTAGLPKHKNRRGCRGSMLAIVSTIRKFLKVFH